MPVFLFAAAFGLDWLVKTDIEKIREAIHTATKAVEEENIDAIEAIISERYSDSYHSTKKHLMYHCRARLSEPLIEKNITRIVSIEVLSPRATAISTVRIFFDKQSYIAQLYKQEIFTKVKLELQKEKDSCWRITNTEILEIDRQPLKWADIEQVRQ